MDNASSSFRTTLVSDIVLKGGSYALHTVSHHRPAAASPRRRLFPSSPQTQAPQTGLYPLCDVGRDPLCRFLAAVVGPRLQPVAQRSLCGYSARCPAAAAGRPRLAATAAQPLAG